MEVKKHDILFGTKQSGILVQNTKRTRTGSKIEKKRCLKGSAAVRGEGGIQERRPAIVSLHASPS